MARSKRQGQTQAERDIAHSRAVEAHGARRTVVVDRSHITVKRDPRGRKTWLEKDSVHWERLSNRAKAILEGRRRS